MNTYSKFQVYLSTLLFVLINALFCFKYLYRLSLTVGIISVFVYFLFICLLLFLYKKEKLQIAPKLQIIILFIYIVSCMTLLFFIPRESLNVDRWEMIEIFWDAASVGNYPYGVHNAIGNYPGPMPFYFILCYPFYLLGEIGLMPILAIIIWRFYVSNKTFNKINYCLLLLLSSLAIYWEVFARSTVFFNSCLFFIWFISLGNLNKKSITSFYLSAAIGGLLFSTRNVFVIPLIFYFIYSLRMGLKFIDLIKWGIVFLLFFVLSFLPFIFLGPEEFLKMNPFIIQSSFLLPFPFVVAFICISIIVALFLRRIEDVIFASGTFLFLLITGYVVYALFINGIQSFLQAGADISYYIFCFPFLLEVMINKKDYGK